MVRFNRPSKIILAVAGVLIVAAVGALLLTRQDSELSPEMARIAQLQKARDVAGLTEMAKRSNTDVARKAVAALGPLGQSATGALIVTMKDPRPKVRSKAAITLNQTISKGVIDQKDAQQALVQAAKSDPDPEVRASALTTLGHTRAYEAFETVLDGMEDTDVGVRDAGYQAMYKILRIGFRYKADDPEPARRKVVQQIRSLWKDPGARQRVEEYYQGRFKKIYEKFAR